VLADSIIRAIAPIMGMKYVDKTLRYTLKNWYTGNMLW
jgi:hypothetical protein